MNEKTVTSYDSWADDYDDAPSADLLAKLMPKTPGTSDVCNDVTKPRGRGRGRGKKGSGRGTVVVRTPKLLKPPPEKVNLSRIPVQSDEYTLCVGIMEITYHPDEKSPPQGILTKCKGFAYKRDAYCPTCYTISTKGYHLIEAHRVTDKPSSICLKLLGERVCSFYKATEDTNTTFFADFAKGDVKITVLVYKSG